MEIWLARHGTTRANEARRLQGQLDYPLSARGRAEVWPLACCLARVRFTAVFSSPLLRARQTAAVIAGKNIRFRREGTGVKICPRLREYGWGVFEGHTWAEIYELYPGLAGKLQDNFRGVLIPGRESHRAFISRVSGMAGSINKSFSGRDRILLVTHGRFINAFLAAVTGLDLKKKWPFQVNTATVSVLKRYCRDNYRLILYNHNFILP